MARYTVTVTRTRRAWNEYTVTAGSEQEARDKVLRALPKGWRVLRVENADETPRYTPLFGEASK